MSTSGDEIRQEWRDSAASPGQRADSLLGMMTFEEKVGVALGDFETVAHFGVPPLKYTERPNGIRGPDNVTAFPAAQQTRVSTYQGSGSPTVSMCVPAGSTPRCSAPHRLAPDQSTAFWRRPRAPQIDCI
jgi:hypothetical protein